VCVCVCVCLHTDLTQDALYLDSDTDAAVDCVGRLGQDGQMCGASAPSDGPTPPMEQRQLHAMDLRARRPEPSRMFHINLYRSALHRQKQSGCIYQMAKWHSKPTM
jgi:hypothetical protein